MLNFLYKPLHWRISFPRWSYTQTHPNHRREGGWKKAGVDAISYKCKKNQPLGSVLSQHLKRSEKQKMSFPSGMKISSPTGCNTRVPSPQDYCIGGCQKAPPSSWCRCTVGTLALAWEPGLANEPQRKSRLAWLMAACSLKQQLGLRWTKAPVECALGESIHSPTTSWKFEWRKKLLGMEVSVLDSENSAKVSLFLFYSSPGLLSHIGTRF